MEPVQLRPGLLCPDLWTYRGEGNANIVLSYIGSDHWATGMVLRLEKLRPSHSAPTSAHIVAYARQTSTALLGDRYVDTIALLHVTQHFLTAISTQIQPLRPSKRNSVMLDTTKSVAILMRDHSLFQLPERVIPVLATTCPMELCLELKLKWAFMPTQPAVSAAKKQACRFCRMQYLKRCHTPTYNPCLFCPLDVFSDNEERMVKGFSDLYLERHTYMKAFVNGKLLEDLTSDAFTGHICRFMGIQDSNHAFQQLWTLLSRILKHNGILRSLKYHQKNLDSLDIQVLYPLLIKHNMSELLGPEESVSWDTVVTRYLDSLKSSNDTAPDSELTSILDIHELRQKAYEFCISTTLKDISIFITMAPKSSFYPPSDADALFPFPTHLGEYYYKIRVADLDIKPFSKFHKYYTQDKEIMDAFIHSGALKTCIE
ncbi:inositol-pentakisphosphate 2-kinase [Synchytrium endobioticum]|uniref:Inositol-pentakisphosphate 2-kinase n=1 Tax=Synchytrium endobioticum TaxID=286115 RepID=A0A507DD55_9FUNG|nr:inositol-pentakisphosphate 2-kinase [Synchytrium endobioticum]